MRRFSNMVLYSFPKTDPIASPLKLFVSFADPFLYMEVRKLSVHFSGYELSEKITRTNLSIIGSQMFPNIFKYSPRTSSGPASCAAWKLRGMSPEGNGIYVNFKLGV